MAKCAMAFLAAAVACIALNAQAQGPATGPSGAPPGRYVPPKLGAPDNRVSGATRGLAVTHQSRLDLLAPPDIGLTAREQPTLYWFNSSPIRGDAVLTIVDEDAGRTVLKMIIPGPLPAGINSFRLAGTRGRIKDGVAYRWSVRVIVSAREPSRNLVASGMIQLSGRPMPAGATDSDALAQAGLWYDAIDAASVAIQQAPGDARLHEKRSVLLEQIGLVDAAAFDRASSP